MRRQLAVAVAPSGTHTKLPTRGLDGLRQRFANATRREEVEIDFLEDDLKQAGEVLAAVTSYVGRLERVLGLGWTSRQALTALARSGDPGGKADDLSDLLADMRRRLERLAERA